MCTHIYHEGCITKFITEIVIGKKSCIAQIVCASYNLSKNKITITNCF